MDNGIERLRARFAIDVAAVLDNVSVDLQPIVEVATGIPLAVEALARFAHNPDGSVAGILHAAHRAGEGVALEAACVRAALARRAELPAGLLLTVNVSPDALHHPLIARTWPDDLTGLIIEVTEHRASRPTALMAELSRLRERGAAIAVDDVGTGYAGLLRLAALRPDFVKIDRTVVSGVATSPAQSAVLEALVAFSHRMGAAVIGEGVEHLDEIVTLGDFDVDFAQGYAIGRPHPDIVPISSRVVAACHEARERVLQRQGAPGRNAASTRAMHRVTSALATASGLADIHLAAAEAAVELRVDIVGVSIVGENGTLREIASAGAVVDTSSYEIADYPATRDVLSESHVVEVHAADPDADPAEKRLLNELGFASLLMIPLCVDGRPIGVLEFLHRTHRRWTTQDVAHGHGLAGHLGQALTRLRI